MAEDSFIICDNLVKIYRVAEHDVVALQGLDLVVNRGELLGMVGVSGSGKTTLMNILGGLDRPTAGRVWVDGKDLLKMSNTGLDRYRLFSVGFVWQQSARNLVPYLNAKENVELPLTISGVVGKKKHARADELLDATGMSDRSRHNLSELSGGEQQRVAIAVALANNPQLLLADEPTGEVDESNALMIYQTIRELNVRFGLTTLIVSHDPKISTHVDRVIAIRDGKISTETVWQVVENEISDNGDDSQQALEERIRQELTVVDSAGRLQVPKEYLEKFNIKGRVQLEMSETGILIRPVDQITETKSAEDLVDQMELVRKSNPLVRLRSRLLSGKGEKSGSGKI